MSVDPAETIAAVWRASRQETQVLLGCLARLERAVALAIDHPPPPESAAAWQELLAAQRAALEASRVRTAMIAALLEERR
jgi:hypothetical protein